MPEASKVLLSKVLLPPISGGRPAGGIASDSEGIPSLGGENIKRNGGMKYDDIRIIPEEFYARMPKGKLQALDVLINKDGAQTGKVGLYDGAFEKAAVNEHLFILRAQDSGELDQVYLFYCVLLPETQHQIHRRITGSAQPGLNSQFVRAVDIPFHSPIRQKKIAHILKTIDRAIEMTEALINKYQQIKAGLMNDLFTRGIGSDDQLRPPREQAPEMYRETPIGWIPKEWEVKSLGELSSKIVDGIHHTPRYVDDGFPFVTVRNLTASTTIDFSNINYVDTKTHQACYSRADPKPGDVLVSKDGTLGVCRIVKPGMPEFSIFVSVALVRVAENLTAERLYFFFESGEYLKQLGYLSAGSGLKHIHLEHLRKFQISLPPLSEQKDINRKLLFIDRKLETERLVLENMTKQKYGLMHDLLTGKVPVTVEPDTEAEAAYV